MKYFVFSQGRISGPYGDRDLLSVAGFSAESLVCPEGAAGTEPSDWRRADSQPELAALFPARVEVASLRFGEAPSFSSPPDLNPRETDVLGRLDDYWDRPEAPPRMGPSEGSDERLAELENRLLDLTGKIEGYDLDQKALLQKLDEKEQLLGELLSRISRLQDDLSRADASKAEAVQGAEDELLRLREELARKDAFLERLKDPKAFPAELKAPRLPVDDLVGELEAALDLPPELRTRPEEARPTEPTGEEVRPNAAGARSPESVISPAVVPAPAIKETGPELKISELPRWAKPLKPSEVLEPPQPVRGRRLPIPVPQAPTEPSGEEVSPPKAAGTRPTEPTGEEVRPSADARKWRVEGSLESAPPPNAAGVRPTEPSGEQVRPVPVFASLAAAPVVPSAPAVSVPAASVPVAAPASLPSAVAPPPSGNVLGVPQDLIERLRHGPAAPAAPKQEEKPLQQTIGKRLPIAKAQPQPKKSRVFLLVLAMMVGAVCVVTLVLFRGERRMASRRAPHISMPASPTEPTGEEVSPPNAARTRPTEPTGEEVRPSAPPPKTPAAQAPAAAPQGLPLSQEAPVASVAAAPAAGAASVTPAGAALASAPPPAAVPPAPPPAVSPAPLPKSVQALDFVKNYSLGGGRGTIESWFQASFLAAPGHQEDWGATPLDESHFVVEYRVLAPSAAGAEPVISYQFKVNLEAKSLEGLNGEAKRLLSGGPGKARPRLRRTAAIHRRKTLSRRASARRAFSRRPPKLPEPKELPLLPLPSEGEGPL